MSKISWAFASLCIALSLCIICFIVRSFILIAKGERTFGKSNDDNEFSLQKKFIQVTIVCTACIYCIYRIPDMIMQGFTWFHLEIYGPISIKYFALSFGVMMMLFYVHFILAVTFKKKTNNYDLVSLAGLAILNGLADAVLIFIINEAVSRSAQEAKGLIIYFLLILLVRVLCDKTVRGFIVISANQIVLEKRVQIISHVLRSPFERFEKIKSGKIEAGLNNDTEVISGVVFVFFSMITSVITLVFCFIYLGVLSTQGFFVSVIAVIVASGIFYVYGLSANKLMNQARDLQNTFFKYISDLLDGHKNLIMHNKKRCEFKKDMVEVCNNYRTKQTKYGLKFVNMYIIGAILTTIVIGAVVFLLPEMINIENRDTIRNYAFVFMYMSGPVNVLLNNTQHVIQLRISWNRINELEKELVETSLIDETNAHELVVDKENNILIEFQDVHFSYHNVDDEVFHVGPINCKFESGEIVYITGGNGSGKSTLGKLLTGLYKADKGKIKINGKELNQWELGEYFSVVFSDVHLFEKLYGIEHKGKKELIEHYLNILRIKDKVSIKEGQFSTINLSSGQRRRLALLLACLENSPVYFFDEWAADQDPEFRAFFYEEILPSFKSMGKCVIAITHDDRYFSTGDKVIKMETGKIVS